MTYAGREWDSPWRSAALDRIERIRKSDLEIQVLDPDGQPLENVAVHVQMQRHAFVFGTAVKAMLLAGERSDFPIRRHRKG